MIAFIKTYTETQTIILMSCREVDYFLIVLTRA